LISDRKKERERVYFKGEKKFVLALGGEKKIMVLGGAFLLICKMLGEFFLSLSYSLSYFSKMSPHLFFKPLDSKCFVIIKYAHKSKRGRLLRNLYFDLWRKLF